VFKEAITESALNLEADAPLAADNVCKTFVVSVRPRAAGQPVLMRTYDTRTANAFQAKIWEAGRATCAAPTFFEPVYIEGWPLFGYF
jgi:predicted acylesterase/phospholipase RssA